MDTESLLLVLHVLDLVPTHFYIGLDEDWADYLVDNGLYDLNTNSLTNKAKALLQQQSMAA